MAVERGCSRPALRQHITVAKRDHFSPDLACARPHSLPPSPPSASRPQLFCLSCREGHLAAVKRTVRRMRTEDTKEMYNEINVEIYLIKLLVQSSR